MGETGRGRVPKGASKALSDAVERTVAATAGTAAEGRERALDLLDEVARRGREAGGSVAKRGQEAGEELGAAIRELIDKSQSRLKGSD
jgi:polyhydroxyalkanoate synthesis regulator phasin